MPATREKLAEFLGEDSTWGDGVKSLIKWQFSLHGDFYEALWGAIKQADDDNLRRLSMGFPLEVESFLDWSRGDLADRLRKAGLDL